MDWKTLKGEDLRSFLEEETPKQYKYVPHNPTSWSIKKHNWKLVYCKSCGLIYLNNQFTQWAVKMGCLNSLHPSFKSIRRSLSR